MDFLRVCSTGDHTTTQPTVRGLGDREVTGPFNAMAPYVSHHLRSVGRRARAARHTSGCRRVERCQLAALGPGSVAVGVDDFGGGADGALTLSFVPVPLVFGCTLWPATLTLGCSSFCTARAAHGRAVVVVGVWCRARFRGCGWVRLCLQPLPPAPLPLRRAGFGRPTLIL